METLDVQGKVETAFERVLQPYIESGDLSVLQLVKSFFTGKPRSNRVSVTVPTTERGLMGENGEPLTWSCPVQIEVTTNGKDDGADHAGLSAITALVTYGGVTFLASLNTAMAGEGFNGLLWESDTRRESEKDGTVLRTRIFGTLEVQPWKAGE
jgi:hypothetical protein